MFRKYADCHIEGFCRSSIGRVASRHRVGSFDYAPNNDGNYLYVAVRACTGDVPNLNYDMLPSEELKTAYKTFIGSSVFLNHKNDDPEDARGAIVDARWHDEDPDDEWVEILMEMDEDRCPKLCKLIKSGEIDTVSMGCFVPGTLVTMSDGTTKTIETVVEGDRVLTLDGSVGAVSYVMSHQHDGLIYEIGSYAQSRPMRLTEEHPVWVRRPQRGEYDTVRGRIEKNNGDGVHVCTCGRKFISHRSLAAHLREEKLKGHESEHGLLPEFDGWVNAADVQIGDYVLDPAIKDSEECDRVLARLLGYYLAEGNFGYDKKRKLDEGVPSSVEWTFNENETEYHAEVMRLVRELGYSPVGPYYKNGGAMVRCNSPELADIMLRLGGRYSWGKHVSEDVMHWDVDAQRDLLEAYFNGDAHWEDGARCAHFEFSTVSSQLAEQIQAMCTRCGIRCTEPRVSTFAQEQSGNRPVYCAQGNFEVAPEGGTSLMAYIDEQGMWRRVTSIRVLEYHGLVYNFEVADSHSYVAEGCAVHNCNVRNTRCSICGNVAEFPFEYCEHVQQKGREFQGKLAYEICNGIDFFECSWVYDPADPTAHTVEMHEDISKKAASKRTFLRKDESGKLAGITRERPHFDSSGKEGVFEDGVRWCETSLWYRQWDDGKMPSSPEDWGEDVTLCDDGSGTLAVIYAGDQIAYFEGSDYMYPQGDAIDFSKALGDDDLAREVLIESSRYDENVNGETVDVAKFEERWIIPDVQPKDYR